MIKINKVIIIGRGTIAKKHEIILRNIKKKLNILKIKSRNLKKENKKLIFQIKKFNPDYIIISSPATSHYKQMMIIENILSKKVVLIEKPLFEKNYKLPPKTKNKYFVGFNLRYDPSLIYLKKYLTKKKYFHVSINCSSFLPSWRKNIDYRSSVSAKKSLGGGVLLELSHEIDYLIWLIGKIKILHVVSKKISNLKINTDDYLNLSAKSGKTLINVSLNFFSRIKRREIIIDGNNFNIFADIINRKIIIYEKKNKIVKSFLKPENYSFIQQHLNIMKRDYSKLCSLNEGINVTKLIDKIKFYS